MYLTPLIYENIKVNITCKSVQVNSASGLTLGSIGIVPLILDMVNHTSVHNFIICTKLKQSLITGLGIAQRYKIGVDWDAYGWLHL